MSRLRIAVGLLALTVAAACDAAPMGFKDSAMAAGDFGPNWKEALVNYAFTSRDALGVDAIQMRSDDYSRRRTAVELSYTRLLSRWNLPDAQANIWFTGGIGDVRGNDFTGHRAAATPGVEVDYETPRLYLVGSARMFRASGLRHDEAMVRAGVSFYAVDYEQLQPWFVIEARRMRELSDKIEVTPMLRFVQNRYVVEVGVNNSRQWRANFLYTF